MTLTMCAYRNVYSYTWTDTERVFAYITVTLYNIRTLDETILKLRVSVFNVSCHVSGESRAHAHVFHVYCILLKEKLIFSAHSCSLKKFHKLKRVIIKDVFLNWGFQLIALDKRRSVRKKNRSGINLCGVE